MARKKAVTTTQTLPESVAEMLPENYEETAHDDFDQDSADDPHGDGFGEMELCKYVGMVPHYVVDSLQVSAKSDGPALKAKVEEVIIELKTVQQQYASCDNLLKAVEAGIERALMLIKARSTPNADDKVTLNELEGRKADLMLNMEKFKGEMLQLTSRRNALQGQIATAMVYRTATMEEFDNIRFPVDITDSSTIAKLCNACRQTAHQQIVTNESRLQYLETRRATVSIRLADMGNETPVAHQDRQQLDQLDAEISRIDESNHTLKRVSILYRAVANYHLDQLTPEEAQWIYPPQSLSQIRKSREVRKNQRYEEEAKRRRELMETRQSNGAETYGL